MNLHRTLSALTLAWLCAAPVATAAAATQDFALGDHGVLVLEVPDGWRASWQAVADGPPTLQLLPAAGPAFEVTVSVLWPAPGATLPDEAMLRAEVGQAAESAAPQSVERTLKVEPLPGTTGTGFYFTATDRAPAPGEYRHLAQGMVRTGGVVLAFTILTHDGGEAIEHGALALLAGAVHRPKGAT